MSIVVTGADGYIGWPLVLRLSYRFQHEKIIGIDHGGRRRWVAEVGADSCLPIASFENRVQAAHEAGYSNLVMLDADLTNYNEVLHCLAKFKPRTILHLAAQPSAPYSQLSADHAAYTQRNNTDVTRNLLWAMHELKLRDTLLVVTTTTGIYGAPDLPIPEGWLEVPAADRGTVRLPWPPMATSWYHMSRGQDALNLWLANFQWGLSILDVRTSIVVGSRTAETQPRADLRTRLDADFYFGVVAHRFAAQAILGQPLTIYGKGGQKKPLITLEDAVESLANAVQHEPDGNLHVYNQFTQVVGIKELAQMVKSSAEQHGLDVEIRHIPNPRVEREDHDMRMDNGRFRKVLLPQQRQSVASAVHDLLSDLSSVPDRLRKLEKTLLPLGARTEVQ